MQTIQLRLLLSLCAVTLTTIAVADTAKGAPPSDAAPKSASEPNQQSESTAISSTQKPATLSGKQQRQRQTDVFKPTEQISEDFAAPMPVDI